MKLFAFQPNGHGSLSFFAIASSEDEARGIVDKHVKDKYMKDGKLRYEATGWGTDDYTLTIAEVGQVIENDNE